MESCDEARSEFCLGLIKECTCADAQSRSSRPGRERRQDQITPRKRSTERDHYARLETERVRSRKLRPDVRRTVSAQETVRIRGTIEHVDGPIFVIKNRDGAEVKLTLTDKPLFVAIVKSTMAEIKAGMFVGSTGMTQADGSQRAIEVHIFPESMRGTGEGHYDWDLKPQSKMTNANVEQTVAGVDGQILSVKYKGIEKKILVTPDTAIVTFVTGDRNDLKPGTKIFVAAKKQSDGTLQAPRITYGKDGLTPPM
jgi:hypothetical protein